MKTGELNVLRGKTGRRRRAEGGQRATPPQSTVTAEPRRTDAAAGVLLTDADSVAAFVRQRKDDAAHAIRTRRERQLRTAEAISDARIRRAYDRECAERERDIDDFWRRFFRRIPKQHDERAPQPKRKDGQWGRSQGIGSTLRLGRSRPHASPRGVRQLAHYSGPVLDARGRRGVYLSVRYLSAKTAKQGCGRRLARYVTDPGHIELDADGRSLIGSNVGDSRTEMSAAFSVIEELNRAARANAKVAFHIIVQLPHDVTPAERAEIMARWCEDCFGSRNLPYVWAVHTPDADGDQRNTHGHVAASFRPLVRVAPFAWDAGREVKAELDNPEAFQRMRERFARTMTEVCQTAGKARVYTALSYAGRGMTIKPGEHLGPHKTRLVRQGQYVAADARNCETIARNEAMLAIEVRRTRDATLARRLQRVREVAERTVSMPASLRSTPAKSQPVIRTAPRDATPVPLRGRSASLPASARQIDDPPAGRITAPPSHSALQPVAQTKPILRRTARPAPAPSSAAIFKPHRAASTTQPKPAGQIMASAVMWLPAERKPLEIDAIETSMPPTSVPTAILNGIAAVANNSQSRSSAVARPQVLPPIEGDIAQTSLSRIPFANRPSQRQAEPRTAPAFATRPPAPIGHLDIALRDAAFGEAAVRRRKRVMAAHAKRRAAAQASKSPSVAARLDWAEIQATDCSFDTAEGFDTMPPLDSIDGFVDPVATRIVNAVRRADAYVFDDHAGMMLLDFAVQRALGIDDTMLATYDVQAGLASIRQEQQHAFARLVREAERRPLAFNMHASRTWPRDLDPPLLARVDRWALDEGFKQDLFLVTAALVRDAHNAAGQHRRGRIRLALPDAAMPITGRNPQDAGDTRGPAQSRPEPRSSGPGAKEIG